MSADAVIPGFWIIRKLGEGPRAQVFLARTERDSPSEHSRVDAASTSKTVALKLYRAGVQQHDWIKEVEALERSAGAHVVALTDIAATAADRVALVLDRLEGGSLATVLRQRSQIAIGEAITIAVPIVETVARMHAAGVAHGAVSAQSVLFSRDGAPVLARFGSAVLVEPQLPRARRAAEELLARDVSATAGFVASVLRCVPVDRDVRGLLAWLEQSAQDGGPDVLTELTTKLFDLGEPGPVSFREVFEPEAASSDGDALTRLVRVELPAHSELAEGARFGAPATAAFLLPAWLTEQLDRWLADGRPLSRLRDAIALRVPPQLAERIVAARTSLSVVRPRVWLIAAFVAVALLAGLTLIPQRSTNGGDNGNPIESGIESGIDSDESSESENAESNFSQDTAVMADDPVTAAVALAAAREQCIRDRSVLCLDGVAQAGSAALGADQELVRALQTGAELPAPWSLNAGDTTVIERLGDSVLLEIAGPDIAVKTILMMKGDAGWRFRDYLP